jgi:hypothetical protein
MRYVATKYYVDLGMTLQEACTITLPYYPSELDAISPYGTNGGIQNSSLWDVNSWGTFKTNAEVTDGVFSSPNWTCTVNSAITGQPANNRLKRRLDPTAKNLQTGPAQLANNIISNPKGWNFTELLENGCHQSVHTLFGYLMITMSSPNEPTFFLHHCNMDRLYHLWADCQGYDYSNSNSLTYAQYEPANPGIILNGIPPTTKYDPVTGQPCAVTLQDKVCYYWDYSSAPGMMSTTISKVFPDTNWPTIRQLWSMGGKPSDPGFDGINYRYGPDAMVAVDALKNNCPDKTWTYVNQPVPSYKRSESEVMKNKEHPIVQRLNEEYHSKVDSGMSSMEALKALAMEECNAIPKQTNDDDLHSWFKMSGGGLQDRICDKPNSETNGESTRADTEVVISNGQVLPVWAIVVATVSALCVIIIVVVVVIFLKKRNIPQEKDLYVDLVSVK